jgi:hypothetical protein
VWVLLEEGVRALSTAVVGVILLGGYDPVPTKVLKVNCQGVAAASVFLRVLVTCHAEVSGLTGLSVFGDLDLDEGVLLGRKM